MKIQVTLLCAILFSCNPRVKIPHTGGFFTVETLMRGDTTKTGFFTTTSFFDPSYDQIEYQTLRGSVMVPNDGTQNFLLCRYDPATYRPIWVAVGGGKGGDGGLNYYCVPPENAVYVVGCFEDTAYFPIEAGSATCRMIISHGMADMFVAKYSYDKGILQWLSCGGSAYSDIVFTDTQGQRHTETLMSVDSASVTIYANFFGSARFGEKTIDAKLTGSAVQISYNKTNGEVRDVGFVRELPK